MLIIAADCEQETCHGSESYEPLSCRGVWVRFHISPYEICDGESGTRTIFSPSTSVSPVSTIPSMLHIHLPPTLYIVFLPAPRFPLSVSFHQCSILMLHLPTTLYNLKKQSALSPPQHEAFALVRAKCTVHWYMITGFSSNLNLQCVRTQICWVYKLH